VPWSLLRKVCCRMAQGLGEGAGQYACLTAPPSVLRPCHNVGLGTVICLTAKSYQDPLVAHSASAFICVFSTIRLCEAFCCIICVDIPLLNRLPRVCLRCSQKNSRVACPPSTSRAFTLHIRSAAKHAYCTTSTCETVDFVTMEAAIDISLLQECGHAVAGQ
jgi:hypothetical protein